MCVVCMYVFTNYVLIDILPFVRPCATFYLNIGKKISCNFKHMFRDRTWKKIITSHLIYTKVDEHLYSSFH